MPLGFFIEATTPARPGKPMLGYIFFGGGAMQRTAWVKIGRLSVRFFSWSVFCTLCMGSNNSFILKTVLAPTLPCTVKIINAQAPRTKNQPMSDDLWRYLRAGLNYLETSGKNYPPQYRHKGNIAYGPLGLTEGAVSDVLQRNNALVHLTAKEVFQQPQLYETVARHYADLLLRHYLKIDYGSMPASEVFYCLQKAWFLGPTAYKQGNDVIASRERKTQAFISKITYPAPFQIQTLILQLP